MIHIDINTAIVSCRDTVLLQCVCVMCVYVYVCIVCAMCLYVGQNKWVNTMGPQYYSKWCNPVGQNKWVSTMGPQYYTILWVRINGLILWVQNVAINSAILWVRIMA